jgi:two-component system cell cycle response regulator
MRFHKAELFLFLLMLLVGIGGLFSWAAFSAVTGGVVVGGVETAANFAFMGAVLSALSVVCGSLLVFPIMTRSLRERGTLQRMTESLSVRSQSLEHAAVTDGLTGMYNRRYLTRRWPSIFRLSGRSTSRSAWSFSISITSRRSTTPMAMMSATRSCVRWRNGLQVFTRYHDVLARLGGEEFAILSPNINERQLFNLSDRIRQAVSDLRIVNGNVTLKVTVSAGLAIWDGVESGEELFAAPTSSSTRQSARPQSRLRRLKAATSGSNALLHPTNDEESGIFTGARKRLSVFDHGRPVVRHQSLSSEDRGFFSRLERIEFISCRGVAGWAGR